tara:strand:+ start:753 stop:956 length:204 start_codon:yes stop_codon:yes gene_type:complete
MMVIENDYKITDTVYLKTDTEQKKRIVAGILVRDTHLVYYLRCGNDETSHYNYEVSKEIDVLITSSN